MIAIDVKRTPTGFAFSVSRDGKPIRSITGPRLEGIADLVARALQKFPASDRQLVSRAATLIDGLDPGLPPAQADGGHVIVSHYEVWRARSEFGGAVVVAAFESRAEAVGWARECRAFARACLYGDALRFAVRPIRTVRSIPIRRAA